MYIFLRILRYRIIDFHVIGQRHICGDTEQKQPLGVHFEEATKRHVSQSASKGLLLLGGSDT